ncbi:MAG: 7-cyano-7-deazaguanine synthase QueC [Acidobacteriota bacterium]
MKRERAVCLVSGGLDSCVSAAVAQAQGLEMAFLHVSYGQRTAKRERCAFEEIAAHYQVQHRLVTEVEHLRRIGASALTDPGIDLPEGQLDRIGIPVSYVPFRNGNLLSIAASWAEALQAQSIYMGAVEEDSSGYPDCRSSFFEAFNAVLDEGTRPETRIRIVTPLIQLPKSDIVTKGLELKAPLHLTWSCYQNEEKACGQCDSCLLRLRGFEEAGVRDPIPYEEAGGGRRL